MKKKKNAKKSILLETNEKQKLWGKKIESEKYKKKEKNRSCGILQLLTEIRIL